MDSAAPDDRLVSEALRRLDLAFVEWGMDGVCRPIAPTPRWFKGSTAWASLPFLEQFVAEARRYLHDHLDGVLASDQFAADSADGELLLRAQALTIDGHLVLVIERLRDASDVRPILRKARERALEHEALVERARRIHRPAGEVARIVDRLREQAGGAVPAIDDLVRAIAALQEAVAALPAPRPTRR